jgi:tetratricopeptide (TPR) repeat protein
LLQLPICSIQTIGLLQKAINDYDQAITLNPENTEVFVNRGITYARLGEHQKAIKDFNQAIKLDPKNARAFYHRGSSYRRLRKEEVDFWYSPKPK